MPNSIHQFYLIGKKFVKICLHLTDFFSFSKMEISTVLPKKNSCLILTNFFCIITKLNFRLFNAILRPFLVLNQNFRYRDQTEICAANKIPYPTIKVYIRKKLRKPKNGKKYVFIHTKDKKNTVRNTFLYWRFLVIFDNL